MELVQDTHRLALMNLMLHGLESDPAASGIRFGDTMAEEGQTQLAEGHADPDQSAVWHQGRRRSAQSDRFFVSDVE